MSRIAYIISAYKDAPHLARLVAALDDRADFYVHIDLNADIHPFEEALGEQGHVSLPRPPDKLGEDGNKWNIRKNCLPPYCTAVSPIPA